MRAKWMDNCHQSGTNSDTLSSFRVLIRFSLLKAESCMYWLIDWLTIFRSVEGKQLLRWTPEHVGLSYLNECLFFTHRSWGMKQLHIYINTCSRMLAQQTRYNKLGIFHNTLGCRPRGTGRVDAIFNNRWSQHVWRESRKSTVFFSLMPLWETPTGHSPQMMDCLL